ncbi:retinol binding protein receptor-domain-containing protein [Chytriomyces cf. hyalinus JEL632]|nr:retinol binding protein receptor-domain-containing protein [Chytriomyces cf. hyalinus JEL632]
MKAAATPIFMLFFLLIGLIFYPVFLSYAHVNWGSRLAAVIGFVTIINATILRVTLYVMMNAPNTPMYRRVLSNLLEILSYAISIIYFGSSILAPEEYENKIRKTYFRNAIHVQSLLRKHDIQFVPKESEEVPTRFDKIKAYFQPKDRRPIWLRGRPQDSIITRIKVFFRITKVPARLIAIFAMIILFTYQQAVYLLLKVLDNSPTISCVFGLASSELVNIFKQASTVMQFLEPVQLLGVSLSDALDGFGVLSDAVNLFRRIIQGSAICAVLLTLGVLTFNLIDLSIVVVTDLGKLRVGNYEGFVKADVSSANAAQASKYMGLQIGFAVIGTVYTMMILMLFCNLFAFFFSVPALRKFVWDLVFQNGTILVAIVLTTILSLIQSFIINRYFVAYFSPEEEKMEEKKPNRQSTRFWLQSLNKFNHIDMFFMFPNLISGIFGFIGSIFVALLTSAVFAYRLDKPSLFSFFSKSGFYSSWIFLEHHHTNPVVLIAVKLFWNVVIPEHHSSMAQFIQSDQKLPNSMYIPVASKEPRSRHARLRWYLAYTLIKNPQLVAYRKQRVQETYLSGYVAKYEVPRLKLERIEKEAAALAKRRVDMRVAETEYWKAHRLREGGETSGVSGDRV